LELEAERGQTCRLTDATAVPTGGFRPNGLTDDEIVQLQQVTGELGIALKAKIERDISQNIAHAYLGVCAGQAVLAGSITRGDLD
jgi:hypothetical protein